MTVRASAQAVERRLLPRTEWLDRARGRRLASTVLRFGGEIERRAVAMSRGGEFACSSDRA
jgi:hypothetical protein